MCPEPVDDMCPEPVEGLSAQLPLMIDVLRSGFADPPVTAAPIMRWWWFGPSVDRDELSRELTAMAGAGFGGSRWPTSTRWGQRPLISCPTPFLPTCACGGPGA